MDAATHERVSSAATVAKLAQTWLRHLRDERRLENTTINEYDRVLSKLVLPKLGDLQLSELTTSHIDAVLDDLGTQSLNRQRKAKVVTGAMLDMAVRHGILAVNPVRGTGSIPRPQTEPTSLSRDDLATIRRAVREWMSKDRPGPKANSDMADIVELMLVTGARMGEVLALTWGDLELDDAPPSVSINATIKTETGKSTYRKPIQNVRTVALPDVGVEVLLRRRSCTAETPIDAVFPTRNGTWQQVNNVERRWRQIRTGADLEWVTPHVFRGAGDRGRDLA